MIQTLITVTDIVYSNDNLVAQIFFTPQNSFVFAEGQFVFLERLDFSYPDGKKMKNAYSIGSSYEELRDKGYFTTIVKKTRDGGMSDYLTNQLRIGDVLDCKWPLWHFVDKQLVPRYLLLSIGSWITPMYAMYKHLLAVWWYEKICHVYGERYRKSVIDTIAHDFVSPNGSIKHLLYLSQDNADGWQQWYVQDWLVDAIAFLGTDIQVFLCGKPAMVDDVIEKLIGLGVDRWRIFFEKY